MKEKPPQAFVKDVIRKTLLLAVALALVLVGLGHTAWAKGLALGSLASVLNFFLMASFLPRLLGVKRGRAEALSLFSLFVRFTVMGAALAVCLYFSQTFSIYTCVPGLFAVQVCLVVIHFLPNWLVAKASGSG